MAKVREADLSRPSSKSWSVTVAWSLMGLLPLPVTITPDGGLGNGKDMGNGGCTDGANCAQVCGGAGGPGKRTSRAPGFRLSPEGRVLVSSPRRKPGPRHAHERRAGVPAFAGTTSVWPVTPP